MSKRSFVALGLAWGWTITGQGAVSSHEEADAQALELARQAIALRSVAGPGNQTPQVAALFREALLKNDFNPKDITITPVDDTALLMARWPGSNPKLKPLVISGHMDVVEAKPADWQRDPFTPVVENGYLFGRGSTDMKLDDTMAIAALGKLRKGGFKPRRDIILGLSGDEETAMKTGSMIAEQLANAELVLNMDGANGVLDDKDRQTCLFRLGGRRKNLCRLSHDRHQPWGGTHRNPGR